ncbi:Proteasomal ubiquitin receptor ADRM1-like protein [Cladobotryum mycophilum]|uniref:Proteasomal ubiquitin receptor ADRM1-like protein n=1 Tax=Cladobotryum mycophilum TaxID=491253 RepID=A0ABR0SFA4_9HYPO
MPIVPIITFKAGQCEVDASSRPNKVTPISDPGYVYLYSEDDLVHFCWRRRDQPLDEPELDLVMVPTDGSFLPYEYKTTPQPSAKTNGRIFVLKFGSSSQRHIFWMQSRPQSRNGDASYFSPRDRKIGDIVHRLLQGEEVNVTRELSSVRNTDDRQDDDDETMEDVEGQSGPRDRHAGGSGGAGADATGGDVREEGSGSREGGADGARAAASSAPDAQSAVRNFLNSLQSPPGQTNPDLSNVQPAPPGDIPYPHIQHLIPSSITVPLVDTLSVEQVDTLLSFLPPSIIMLASQGYDGKTEPTGEQLNAAMQSLPLQRKRDLVKKVVRSPQFHQSLVALTMALRDGGLPSIADALGVRVENGGYLRGGMPLGGGSAIEAFVNGIKKMAQEKRR